MNKKKTTIIVICIALLTALFVTLVFAYLTGTDDKENTFAIGDVHVALDEVKVNPSGEFIKDTEEGEEVVENIDDATRITDGSNTYNLVPGVTYVKDPTVTVQEGSVTSWVFIEIVKTDDFDDYISSEIDDAWTPLEGYEDVYFMEVETSDEPQMFPVLSDNKITVKDTITHEMLTSSSFVEPNISIKAYAIQKKEMNDPKVAWESSRDADFN